LAPEKSALHANREFGGFPIYLTERFLRSAVLSVAANDGCPRECGTHMCDKCIQLDKEIEHYERLASGITDRLTLDRIRESVREMRAQKAALHLDEEQ
jgi:hypothetical protein